MHLPVDKCITIALALLDEWMVLSNVFLHAGEWCLLYEDGKGQKKVITRKAYVKKAFVDTDVSSTSLKEAFLAC